MVTFPNSIIEIVGDPDAILDGPLGLGDVPFDVVTMPPDAIAKGAPFYIRIDNEFILVGTIVGNTCSDLTRGVGISNEATHSDGAKVYLVLLGESLEALLGGAALLDGSNQPFTGDIQAPNLSIDDSAEVDGELQVFGDLYLNRFPALTGVNTGTPNVLYVASNDIEFAPAYTHSVWYDAYFGATTYHGVSGDPATIGDLYALFIDAPVVGADLTTRAWSLGLGGGLHVVGDVLFSGLPTVDPGPGMLWYDPGDSNRVKYGT